MRKYVLRLENDNDVEVLTIELGSYLSEETTVKTLVEVLNDGLLDDVIVINAEE